MEKQISIKKEIDLVIRQANAFIDFLNSESSFSEFGDKYLRFANESDMKQDMDKLKSYLWSKSKSIDSDFLQNILDFDALLKAIHTHGTEVTGEMYRNWYQYFQEAQNELKPRFNNDYLRH